MRIVKELAHRPFNHRQQRALLTVLLEGGLAGHLQHLYENTSLTFGELKAVLSDAAAGRLEHVSEKLDGQNIFFGFDPTAKVTKFARNKGDIKRGGMARDEVSRKWLDKPAVQNAFLGAYDVIHHAISSLTNEQQSVVFGEQGDVWYSAEILSTDNPNVINYDQNVISPHAFGAHRFDAVTGSSDESFDSEAALGNLKQVVNQLQTKAAEKGWKFIAPQIYPLVRMNKQLPLKTALGSIDAILAESGLTDNNTIGDFIKVKLTSFMDRYGIPSGVADLLGKRMLDAPDKPARISSLRALLPTEADYVKVVALDRNKAKIFKSIVKPIELLISEFATELLAEAQSLIAVNPGKAIQSMRREVQAAIDKIKTNPSSLEFLESQLEKLRGVDKITSSMEGIVFRFKGQSYKFTGQFAPINQLIGALRYGGRGFDDEEGFVLGGGNAPEGDSKVAIFPGAFKPYHRGHDRVIRLAAAQVEKLYLLISTGDRIKPGEVPLLGSTMQEVWQRYILQTLPSNVEASFVENPVTAAFVKLHEIDASGQNVNVYMIAGEEDVGRFSQAGLSQEAPRLTAQGMVTVAAVPRFGNVSGTDMRSFIAINDKEQFRGGLPKELNAVSDQIFDIIYNSGMNVIASSTPQKPKKINKKQEQLSETAMKTKETTDKFAISTTGRDLLRQLIKEAVVDAMMEMLSPEEVEWHQSMNGDADKPKAARSGSVGVGAKPQQPPMGLPLAKQLVQLAVQRLSRHPALGRHVGILANQFNDAIKLPQTEENTKKALALASQIISLSRSVR